MIREARVDDIPELAALCGELGYPSSEAEVAARVRVLFDSDDDEILVATDDADRAIGWIHARINRSLELNPYGQIAGLVVTAAHRSRGVGAELISHAEEWMRAKGVPEVRVRSNVTRERAHRFYLRSGYQLAKTSRLFVKTL